MKLTDKIQCWNCTCRRFYLLINPFRLMCVECHAQSRNLRFYGVSRK